MRQTDKFYYAKYNYVYLIAFLSLEDWTGKFLMRTVFP